MDLMEAREGMSVRCIDDVFGRISGITARDMGHLQFPKKGKVYTVRKVVRDAHGMGGVLLNEVYNALCLQSKMGIQEPPFALRRFELVPS